MNLKKLKQGFSRTGAAFGIATNLATVPVTKDATPTLAKQYAKYSKEVSLPEIRREIRRTTTTTQNPGIALDKRASRRLRKP